MHKLYGLEPQLLKKVKQEGLKKVSCLLHEKEGMAVSHVSHIVRASGRNPQSHQNPSIWKESTLVVDLEELEEMDASDTLKDSTRKR